ncbi:Kelch repeat type 2 and Kelch repeat type 1 domain containing protein [Aphelenchoides fujianensis]|nr:Kelch repeat type 2 and Kelch repeat type 1 domain containing protein [Aphelenchoides fujianensis]
MRWTVHLEGGPRRVNAAACAIGSKVFLFGGYCSGEIKTKRSPVDVFVLDTATYRWSRVFGEQPNKRHSSTTNRTVSFTDQQDAYQQMLAPEEEDYAPWVPLDEEETPDIDVEIDWQYNPLAVEMEALTEEHETFKSVPFHRYGHTVVSYNGKAYLWGGRNDEYGASKRIHVFDPVTNSWSSLDVEGFIPGARDGHSAVVFEHKMIVFGGFEEENQRFSQETYVFDFLTNTWAELKTTGTPPQYRDFHSACVLGDRMYVHGGRSDERGQWHTNVDFYDPFIYYLDLKTNEWVMPKQTRESAPPGRRSNSLWAYKNKVFMFGGYESKFDRHFNDLYSFDPATSKWSVLRPAGLNAPSPRRRQCSVMVGERLFLFGGTRPHATRRSALTDLGDLYVLDYESRLSSICIEKLVSSSAYPKYGHLLPKCLRDDIEATITPNTLSSPTSSAVLFE